MAGEKDGTEGIHFKFRNWNKRTKTDSETDETSDSQRKRKQIF